MKKRIKLLLEVLILILLPGGLIFFGINYVKHNMDARPHYQVIFKDVDNLMVGAPVRIMGIDVGYVTNVEPAGNKVYVSFVISKKNIKIPEGATINIQFTGLVGSKSIEIEAPGHINKSPKSLHIIEPVRIGSLINIQKQISQATLDSSQNILEFFGNGEINTLKKNIKSASQASGNFTNIISDSKKLILSTNKSINTGSAYTKEFLSEQNKNINEFYNTMSSQNISKQSRSSLKSFNNSVQNFSISLENGTVQNINSLLYDFNNNIRTTKNKTKDIKDNTSYLTEKTHQAINNTLSNLEIMLDFTKNMINSANIDKLHKKSEILKNSTEIINKKIK